MRARSALVLVALAACRMDFPPAWRVDGLRVIAVTLDPPEIAPGETTQVHVIAVDPQMRAVSMRWVACPPTVGQTSPSNFLCDSPLAVRGESDRFALTAPQIRAGSAVIPVAIRVAVCAGGEVTIDDAGASHCTGSDSWEVTRTLRISATERNQNPVVESVLLDGTPWPDGVSPRVTACTGRANCVHPVRVVLGDTAREVYLSGGAAGGAMIRERITTHYYATGGTLQTAARSDPTESVTADMQQNWTAPTDAATVDFWFTVDDGRGGVTELTRRLIVTP